jgi:hypothetical protein
VTDHQQPVSVDDPDERAVFLQEFDYVDMRSRLTRVELAKKPHFNEEGVLFHSPTDTSVSYDTVFQTTHDFLDLNTTLLLYPLFVDLPSHLRPSKARYDATKQSEDQALRVRCLFCRGRFGGKNAKAIWERHVKEHWPKQGESTNHTERRRQPHQVLLESVDRKQEYPKEETRRPMRQIQQKRPTGSNTHNRNRSHDSSAWAPTSRYNASTSSPSPPSSRASSEEFHEIPRHRVTAPAVPSPAVPIQVQYISSRSSSSSSSDEASASDAHSSDAEEHTVRIPFLRTPYRSPRKRANLRTIFQRSPGFADDLDTFTFQSCWDVDANLDWIEQTSKPCLSKTQLQAALDLATTRLDEEESPRKTARVYVRNVPIPNVAIAAIPGLDVPHPASRKRVREEDVEFVEGVAWMADTYSLFSSASSSSMSSHKRRHTESGGSVGGFSDSGSSGEDADSSLEYGFDVASPQLHEDEDAALMTNVDDVDWAAVLDSD